MDVCFCVISPWKEKSEVKLGTLLEMLVLILEMVLPGKTGRISCVRGGKIGKLILAFFMGMVTVTKAFSAEEGTKMSEAAE